MGWIQVGETRQFVEPCVERLIAELRGERDRLRERVVNLERTGQRYLDHSDSGTYRDAAGLRPGGSPAGEDFRAALSKPQQEPKP